MIHFDLKIMSLKLVSKNFSTDPNSVICVDFQEEATEIFFELDFCSSGFAFFEWLF